MTARLEGDVERRAACGLAGGGQGVDLGVRSAVAVVPALADAGAVAHDHGADERVGLDGAAALLGQRQARCIQGSSASVMLTSAQGGLSPDSPSAVAATPPG